MLARSSALEASDRSIAVSMAQWGVSWRGRIRSPLETAMSGSTSRAAQPCGLCATQSMDSLTLIAIDEISLISGNVE